jgi:hypothetical protein
MKNVIINPLKEKVKFSVFHVVVSLIILSYIINSSLIFSQECLFDDAVQMSPPDRMEGIYESKNGWALTPFGTIRVLVVFAEINYDTGTDPNPNSTTGWSIGSLPDWVDELFDPIVEPLGIPTGHITRYYHEASYGNYLVLGDYLLAPENGGIFKVQNSLIGQGSQGLLSATIQQVNATMNGSFITGHNLNHASYFDNWTKMELGKPNITPSIDSPYKYDNVIFIFRNRPGLNDTGSAYSDGFSTSLLGYAADTHIIVGSYSDIPAKALRHEFAHLLFGGNNFHCSGGGVVPFG